MKKRKWIVTGLLVLAAVVPAAAYLILPVRFYPGDPADAKIIYDDIEAFAKAHELGRANDFAADIYAIHYFDRASDHVESLVRQLEISAGSTAAHAREYPATYDAIVSRLAAIKAVEPSVRDAYEKLEAAYPDAVYPPVYLAFSGFRARGLIRPYGIITGGEYFIGGTSDASSPGWFDGRKLIVQPELLPGQLIHELAHIQQARNSPLSFVDTGSVLNWTLFEGAADYVANTITGTHTNAASHAFLEAKGDPLWCAFYDSLDASRRTHWMDAAVFGAPPGGFAASFGYEIVAAYVENHPDKTKALVNLIELRDYQVIYENSGYRQRLETLCGNR